MSLKDKLSDASANAETEIMFTYSGGTDVFHFNETHVETAINETDVVDRLATVITSGLGMKTEHGYDPLESLRGSGMLDEYERGSFSFGDYVAGAIRDNFYDADLIDESTERFDHKRGFTTLTAKLTAPMSELSANESAYSSIFAGWDVSVNTNAGTLTFTV